MSVEDLYAEIILDHNRKSPHKGTIENATAVERGHNPSCGDDLTLHLNSDGKIITDAKFSGHGCAISQASMSIMIDLVKGQDVCVAKEKAQTFFKMIQGEELSQEEKNKLGDAQIFQSLSTMPARAKCGTLSWHCLDVAIDKAATNQNSA